ncbi:UNVERIFIED_CONTAM: hypothetical protein GTU68_014138, partial [Idotea baltica]|nr:hypothetical protein [Idotea baltica]
FGRKRVLDNVHIKVPNGQFVALLGQNGAGKTTLFSIVTGLYAAHEGEIRIGGHDLRSSTQAALGSIGIVFQRPTLDRDLTVLQNLRYFCNLHGISAAEASKRIDTALVNHDMSELQRRKVAELSGGQQRRIELLRSTLHDPNFLLLDEPTVGLDHANRMEFVSSVKALCSQRSTGALWATHLMDEVEDADYIYILHHGKIMFEGGSDNLLEEHGKNSIAELYSHLTSEHADAVTS